jgi:Transposase DDE domain
MQSEQTGKPRVVDPQRKQAVIRFEMPQDTLEPSHPARVLWELVGTLNLAPFLAGAKAVVGVAGRVLDEIEQRIGCLPKTLLSDANHAAHECIRDAARRGVRALIAVPERSKDSGPNAADDAPIAEWRNRMQTEEAKDQYRARAGLCELMNAHLRSHHGVNPFLVRGLGKVTCVALLAALASNLLQHAPTLLT